MHICKKNFIKVLPIANQLKKSTKSNKISSGRAKSAADLNETDKKDEFKLNFSQTESLKSQRAREDSFMVENDPHLKKYYSKSLIFFIDKQNFINYKKKYLRDFEEEVIKISFFQQNVKISERKQMKALNSCIF